MYHKRKKATIYETKFSFDVMSFFVRNVILFRQLQLEVQNVNFTIDLTKNFNIA